MANKNPNTTGLKPFNPGISGNPKGRPVAVKKRIENLIERNLDEIESAMEKATPSDRIGMVLGLSKLI